MKVTHKSNAEGAGVIAMVVLSLLLVVGQAEAAVITYNFAGSISDVGLSLFTPSGTGSNGFNTGLTLTGSYTYNTATLPLVPGIYSPVLSNLNLQVGNYSASLGLGANLIFIGNNILVPPLTDTYFSQATVAGAMVKGLSPSFFDISLVDPTGSVFSSDALPTGAPSLGDFASNRWRLVFAGGNIVQGSLTSLQAVPLPASVFLFGAGLVALVGLGAGRFRRIRGVHA